MQEKWHLPLHYAPMSVEPEPLYCTGHYHRPAHCFSCMTATLYLVHWVFLQVYDWGLPYCLFQTLPQNSTYTQGIIDGIFWRCLYWGFKVQIKFIHDGWCHNNSGSILGNVQEGSAWYFCKSALSWHSNITVFIFFYVNLFTRKIYRLS